MLYDDPLPSIGLLVRGHVFQICRLSLLSLNHNPRSFVRLSYRSFHLPLPSSVFQKLDVPVLWSPCSSNVESMGILHWMDVGREVGDPKAC